MIMEAGLGAFEKESIYLFCNLERVRAEKRGPRGLPYAITSF
jgi:hypothetical protein